MAKPDFICKDCSLYKTHWCRKWLAPEQDPRECPNFEEINGSGEEADW